MKCEIWSVFVCASIPRTEFFLRCPNLNLAAFCRYTFELEDIFISRSWRICIHSTKSMGELLCPSHFKRLKQAAARTLKNMEMWWAVKVSQSSVGGMEEKGEQLLMSFPLLYLLVNRGHNNNSFWAIRLRLCTIFLGGILWGWAHGIEFSHRILVLWKRKAGRTHKFAGRKFLYTFVWRIFGQQDPDGWEFGWEWNGIYEERGSKFLMNIKWCGL